MSPERFLAITWRNLNDTGLLDMKYFVYTIILIVAAAVIAGFFIVGSPRGERLRRFDDLRVQNLQFLQSEVINYWQNKERLPDNLDALRDDIRGISIPVDPRTGEVYGYEIKGPLSFSLCANFSLPGRYNEVGDPKLMRQPMGVAPYGRPGSWEHDTGRVCFDRTIDKDIYKPIKQY